MTGLDDLRDTLERHADSVVDDRALDRHTDVHLRVRAVRRRRRAVGAGVAAAALAVAGVVTLLPGGKDAPPEPAHEVVGVPAPDELTALGYRYTFTTSVEGVDGRAVVKLEGSPKPRLVTWATSTDDQRARVQVDIEPPLAYDVPDFGDWVEVPAGVTAKLTVRVEDGNPGLAVYTRSSDQPAGITKDGVTFRETVEGRPVLGATIGDPGEADVTVDPSRYAPALDLRFFCSGGPDDTYVHLALGDDEVTSGGGCDAIWQNDPASFDTTVVPLHSKEDDSVRLYVTHGPNGPPVDDPDLRIGLGVYAAEEPPSARASSLPRYVEEGGHLWELSDRVGSMPGAESLEARVPDTGSPVLARISLDAVGVQVVAVLDGHETYYQSSAGTRGVTFQQIVSPGSRVALRPAAIDGGPGTIGPADSFQLGFYERAD
ncbi:MAG: hypothetical protein ABWZ91_05230 [Nocardioides sp.]|jgi:hypothetical protein